MVFDSSTVEGMIPFELETHELGKVKYPVGFRICEKHSMHAKHCKGSVVGAVSSR